MTAAVRRRLSLRLDGAAAALTQSSLILDDANDQLIWQGIDSRPSQRVEVLSRIYPEDGPSRTVVTIVRQDGACDDVLLDTAHPALLDPSVRVTRGEVVRRYMREGIEHIFGGPDHILFVLGLLLLGGTLRSLVKTVTAFTLAHSITLTIAATGVWNPGARIVEPLIALSIVAIAIENLRRADRSSGRDLRPWFAFGFGLIHGFGFAGALAEVGLPHAALGTALASFNIGVEIGQVTIVLCTAPLLAFIVAKRPAFERQIICGGSTAIGLCGSFWFVSRMLGG